MLLGCRLAKLPPASAVVKEGCAELTLVLHCTVILPSLQAATELTGYRLGKLLSALAVVTV